MLPRPSPNSSIPHPAPATSSTSQHGPPPHPPPNVARHLIHLPTWPVTSFTSQRGPSPHSPPNVARHLIHLPTWPSCHQLTAALLRVLAERHRLMHHEQSGQLGACGSDAAAGWAVLRRACAPGVSGEWSGDQGWGRGAAQANALLASAVSGQGGGSSTAQAGKQHGRVQALGER
eukprot:365919-Chlamydomonas_euryale.AAC.1